MIFKTAEKVSDCSFTLRVYKKCYVSDALSGVPELKGYSNPKMSTLKDL